MRIWTHKSTDEAENNIKATKMSQLSIEHVQKKRKKFISYIALGRRALLCFSKRAAATLDAGPSQENSNS